MIIPRWYKRIGVAWLFIAAFWWFAAGFVGESFFSMPKLAGPSEGTGWEINLVFQLVVIFAFLAPPLLLPVALIMGILSKRNRNAPD
jgi:hypothetical protein